ncbi:MAG: hypothetical protein CMG09_04635 [Candidatus Marinimicrobia bacterium]|jgi:uncharacterized membrane protein YgdD (TMEM256/DUF423 family)|nr:hypothetical protein [Candidatus Neomarinimicrobiota bacterium]|tara:strand:+ start:1425 stop:1799 length:375 start_codon:yes stop_codon:yes gene_type:complete
MFKTGILLGTFLAFMTVVLGAFGAHALKEQLSAYGQSVYDKAIFYQMFHSLAILFVSILQYSISDLDLSICIWLFFLGIILFSGSLYILALTNIKWLGAITPIGGMLFIVSWLIIFYKVLYLNT